MNHPFSSVIIRTGNRGSGTASYRGYDRSWDVAVAGKAVIHCSSNPLLGGDPSCMNPEDLLLSALSACHMLWYLHLACEAGITVTGYTGRPVGIGTVETSGAGRFVSATLHPVITVLPDTDIAAATALHGRIHAVCFIGRSVNFPVHYEPDFRFTT